MGLTASIGDAICWLSASLCILLTALPLSKHKSWWVRVWDFPREQITVLGILSGSGLLLLGGWPSRAELTLAGILGLALAFQLRWILPYTRLWPCQGTRVKGPPNARTLRLVVVNVLMTNRKIDGLGDTLAATDPDLVLVLEPDRWWTERLASLLPGHPHRVLHPLDNTYGMALFSKLDLLHPEVRFLLKDDIPSIRTRVRLRSGEDILFIGLHPEPPSPTEAASSLPRDAELVIVGREAAREPKPVIVAGDLNDVAWSHTSQLFRRLSKLIDPRIGRGFYNSFHAAYPLMRWPLDHVFYSPEFLLRDLHRLPAFGSDHFPILIELDYHPRAADLQEPEPAAREDHVEARETVKEAVAEQAG